MSRLNFADDVKLSAGDFVALLSYIVALESVQQQTLKAVAGLYGKTDESDAIVKAAENGRLADKIFDIILTNIESRGSEHVSK